MTAKDILKGTSQKEQKAAKKAAAAYTKRIKQLEALVEKQEQTIADMRKTRVSLPSGRQQRTGKTFVRVIVPDSHGAHIDHDAARAFLSDLRHLKPKQLVLMGDHLDCGGFLAQHHALGFIPECDFTFVDDVEATNQFLDKIQQRTGNVESYYIMGNHEARIERWIIKQVLANSKDAAFLHSMFGPENVLHLADRKIKPIKRNIQYNGLKKRGTLKLGKCLFHHGTITGVNAAKKNLDSVGTNVCFAHTHSAQSYTRDWAGGVIGAWNFGCLCEINPLYGDTKVSNWTHGYGVQIVARDGTFMTIPVPIIDGKSYLGKLLKM